MTRGSNVVPFSSPCLAFCHKSARLSPQLPTKSSRESCGRTIQQNSAAGPPQNKLRAGKSADQTARILYPKLACSLLQKYQVDVSGIFSGTQHTRTSGKSGACAEAVSAQSWEQFSLTRTIVASGFYRSLIPLCSWPNCQGSSKTRQVHLETCIQEGMARVHVQVVVSHLKHEPNQGPQVPGVCDG